MHLTPVHLISHVIYRLYNLTGDFPTHQKLSESDTVRKIYVESNGFNLLIDIVEFAFFQPVPRPPHNCFCTIVPVLGYDILLSLLADERTLPVNLVQRAERHEMYVDVAGEVVNFQFALAHFASVLAYLGISIALGSINLNHSAFHHTSFYHRSPRCRPTVAWPLLLSTFNYSERIDRLEYHLTPCPTAQPAGKTDPTPPTHPSLTY